MSDESKHDRLSLDPAKFKRKRLQSGQERATSGANGSHDQSDASSTDNSLSKPEPAPPPSELQHKSKEIIEINDSTQSATLHRKRIFGTNDEDSTLALGRQVAGLVPTKDGKLDSQNLKWALTTVYGICPKDELEGLLAVQMVGVHRLAIECLRRASVEGQTAVVMDANVNHATKLLRTFTAQMEVLNRHRGKVSQQVLVGNVNVSEGGQAIVGSVSHDGRGRASTEDDADKGK